MPTFGAVSDPVVTLAPFSVKRPEHMDTRRNVKHSLGIGRDLYRSLPYDMVIVMTDSDKMDAHKTLEDLQQDVEHLRQRITLLEAELESARQLADRDPLCPLLNRRAFKRELEREIARSERYKTALSLLFIDLDAFKSINDREGHEAGDRVLLKVAETLQNSVRQNDIVGRLGGDEFGVVLIEAGPEEASICRSAIGDRLATACPAQVSASIGTASWTEGQTATQLLACADQDMFRQKSSKRHTPNT